MIFYLLEHYTLPPNPRPHLSHCPHTHAHCQKHTHAHPTKRGNRFQLKYVGVDDGHCASFHSGRPDAGCTSSGCWQHGSSDLTLQPCDASDEWQVFKAETIPVSICVAGPQSPTGRTNVSAGARVCEGGGGGKTIV